MTDRYWAHRGLIVLASAAAIAAAAVHAVVWPASLPLAPQVTAVAPLAIFYDLRWLSACGLAWPAFTALAAGIVAARACAITALIRLSWPPGRPAPPLAAAFRSALAYTVVTAALLSPVVCLSFGASILPFSWPFLACVAIMLTVAATVSHGAISGTWWCR